MSTSAHLLPYDFRIKWYYSFSKSMQVHNTRNRLELLQWRNSSKHFKLKSYYKPKARRNETLTFSHVSVAFYFHFHFICNVSHTDQCQFQKIVYAYFVCVQFAIAKINKRVGSIEMDLAFHVAHNAYEKFHCIFHEMEKRFTSPVLQNVD